MKSTKKLAKLLRSSEEIIQEVDDKMSQITGKGGVVDEIVEENDKKVQEVLQGLGIAGSPSAEEVFSSLQEKLKKDDESLFNHFHRPDFSTSSGCSSLINATKELTGNRVGFFIKTDKAKDLLRQNPPKNIMAYLGYGNDVDKMLEKEDIFELFSALRFVEESRWLNEVFFKAYYDLKADDFEERKVKVLVLPERWAGIGEKFLGKKLHPMSHLKEMGVIFVIPVTHDFPVKSLYLFFMTLHYTYEVYWHSSLFKKYSQESNFTEKMIDALQVKVGMEDLPKDRKMSWRIIPSYLAKKNTEDPRLKEPHINPEAWHYFHVAKAISSFSRRFPGLGLDFWDDLGVVGGLFPDEKNQETLVSFDLFDNGISVLKNANFELKYLYHQQEALWNKFFRKYMGKEEMNEIMMDNLHKGAVTFEIN